MMSEPSLGTMSAVVRLQLLVQSFYAWRGVFRHAMAIGTAVRGCMIRFSRRYCYNRVTRAAIALVVFGIVVPVLAGLLFGGTPLASLTLAGSSFLLQAAGAAVGVGLGFHPVPLLAIMTSVALAYILVVFEVLDLFAEQSERVRAWIDRIDEKTKGNVYLRRYGVLALVPLIWLPVVSLYGSPLVAWIFRWDRMQSIIAMLAGWIVACAVVMAATMGIFQVLF